MCRRFLLFYHFSRDKRESYYDDLSLLAIPAEVLDIREFHSRIRVQSHNISLIQAEIIRLKLSVIKAVETFVVLNTVGVCDLYFLFLGGPCLGAEVQFSIPENKDSNLL